MIVLTLFSLFVAILTPTVLFQKFFTLGLIEKRCFRVYLVLRFALDLYLSKTVFFKTTVDQQDLEVHLFPGETKMCMMVTKEKEAAYNYAATPLTSFENPSTGACDEKENLESLLHQAKEFKHFLGEKQRSVF
jgi:hypothetical protein